MILAKIIKPFSRAFSTTPSLNQPRSLVKLKKLQADFQCEDGRPVYLKMGFCDRMLYSSTIVGCVVGTFLVLCTLYDYAKPPTWKTKTC